MRTLLETREAMGLTQRQMTRLLGTTVGSYARWELKGVPGGRADLRALADLLCDELTDQQVYSVGVRVRAADGDQGELAKVRAALQMLAVWPEAMVDPTAFGPWTDLAAQVVEPLTQPTEDQLGARWRQEDELDPEVAARLDAAEKTLQAWSTWMDAPVPHLVCAEGRAAARAHREWRERYEGE